MKIMGRSALPIFICFLTFLVVLLGWVGIAWLGLPLSNQELLANFAHAEDFFRALKLSGAWPWWTPAFLGGTSLSAFWLSPLSSLFLLSFSAIFGMFSGPKLASLFIFALGGIFQFAFVRSLTRSSVAACCAALAFLLLPSQWVRLGGTEHFVVVVSFACLPLVFWALYGLMRRPSTGTALLAAVAISLLVLAYSKTAVMALPALCIFTLALIDRTKAFAHLPRLRHLVIAGGITFLLCILPNLPTIREWTNWVRFDLSPLLDWQRAFSTKSAVLWFDRGDWLTDGMPSFISYTVMHGSQYLGVVPIIVFGILFLFRRSLLYHTSEGGWCRLFIVLTLLQHWLSFGPYTVVTGQLNFLQLSHTAPNWSAAVSWAVLALQGWLCFVLFSPRFRWRYVIGAFLCAIYLFVPGFRLLSWLPLFSDIRAPFDFYQITGVFCLSVATGIASWLLLREIPSRVIQASVVALAVTLALWDLSPYFRPFFHERVTRQTQKDFFEAMDFLRKDPRQGAVFCVSGRYFYLLTPMLSGRNLVNEAFHLHYMQRGTALLQTAALSSPQDLSAYLRLAGVSFVLVDRKDPDISEEFKNRFRKILSPVHTNANFEILENKESLVPGFLAFDYLVSKTESLRTANSGLRLSQFGFVTLQLPSKMEEFDGFAGFIDQTGSHFRASAETRVTRPFQSIKSIEAVEQTFDRAVIRVGEEKGWLIFNQAYHPDWTATANGENLDVYRALEGFLAVRTPDNGGDVTFCFIPPTWYQACIWIALGSWLVLGFFFLCFPFLPRSLRKRIFPPRTPPSLPKKLTENDTRPPVERPLLIIPTYNENETLQEVLDQSLLQDARLHVLIVDDHSEDGTPELVRRHHTYSKRVHLLERPKKSGLGSAYKDGFQWAMKKKYDCVIEMDADMSHDPKDIPLLIEALQKGADAAIGSRYLGGVRVLNWPQHRLFLSTSASRYTHFLTRLPLTDPTSGFKALRVSALEALDWLPFRAEGYGFQIELHYYLWKLGARLVEIPIVFTERRKGATKMSLRIAVEAAIRVLLLGVEGGKHV